MLCGNLILLELPFHRLLCSTSLPRFCRLSDDVPYLYAARRAIVSVVTTEGPRPSNLHARGAIAGSCPIYSRTNSQKLVSYSVVLR